MISLRRYHTLLLIALLLAKSDALSANSYPLTRSLLNPGTNVQLRTQHGTSVAIDGDLAVVGVPNDNRGDMHA